MDRTNDFLSLVPSLMLGRIGCKLLLNKHAFDFKEVSGGKKEARIFEVLILFRAMKEKKMCQPRGILR